MKPRPRFTVGTTTRAFTLIELLVVIAIIATLSGMVLAGILSRAPGGARVSAAARGIERMLLDARNRAITSGQTHAVVFHIENAGSGRVLRNRSPGDAADFPGRHWAAIIGPYPPQTSGTQLYENLPRLGSGSMANRTFDFGSAQRLSATVARLQIGERFYLPKGVRFLALGDAEDNLHNPANVTIPTTTAAAVITDWSVGTATRTGIAGLSNTYPRPWFGFLVEEGASWRLHPWGSYDTAIPGSGLDYECTNRWRSGSTALTRTPVTDSTNHVLCTCGEETGRIGPTPAANSFDEVQRPCADENGIGSPRPLVNGYWMDFMVVFLPNGQARGLAFYNRNHLFSYASNTGTPDRINANKPTNTTFHGRDDAIIVYEHSVTGGTAITIGRDSIPSDDETLFSSPHQALASLLPLYRVIVNDTTGDVRVEKPFRSIDRWLEAQERGVPTAQRIWANGWELCTASDPDPQKIRVSGVLTEDMLKQRDPYPWIKPKP